MINERVSSLDNASDHYLVCASRVRYMSQRTTNWNRKYSTSVIVQNSFDCHGEKATRTCGVNHLYSGLEVEKEGRVYHIRSIWDEHEDDDKTWGILLIDDINVFNESNW